jgi:hypothetical protein
MDLLKCVEGSRITQSDILYMLQNRFSGGVMYLSRHLPQRVYRAAQRKGLISKEGRITAQGHSQLFRFDACDGGKRKNKFSVGT